MRPQNMFVGGVYGWSIEKLCFLNHKETRIISNGQLRFPTKSRKDYVYCHLKAELGSSNKNDMGTLAMEKDGIHDIFSSKGDLKEDMNMKVEKILELISAEEKDGKCEDHYKLVYLVENFYKNYLSLCGRYDNLLDKHVNHKEDSNEESADSSDSETLSESSEDKANYIKNREENSEWKLRNTNYEIVLEDVQKENHEEGLVSENIELSKKLNSVELSNSMLLEKMRAVEDSVKELNSENESLKNEIENLKCANEIARVREENDKTMAEENTKLIEKDLKDKIEWLEAQKAELEQQMRIDCENYEGEVEARDELIHELQVVLEEKLSDITQLENDKKQLHDDLKRAISEKTKLREDIQTLEVEFCLSNQKYKVTKSEYKQKEEHHKKKMKEVQQKCRALEQQNVDLFEEINYLEYEITQGKEALAAQVMPIIDAFQHLEVESEKRCWNVQTRIFELSEELRATKDQFKRVIECKQKELEESKRSLEDKDEEKREAIRQLCLVSEYYRESCSRMSRSMSLQLSKRYI